MNKEKTSKEAVNSALRKTDVNSNTAKPILQDSFTTERHPKSKEKFYVTYHKSEDDWRKRVLTKKEFDQQEKESIQKYNDFLNSLRSKSKSLAIQIDFVFEKIKIQE